MNFEMLDNLWEEINAMGGVPSSEYERGVNDTVGRVLALLEKMGAQDPVTQPRQINRVAA